VGGAHCQGGASPDGRRQARGAPWVGSPHLPPPGGCSPPDGATQPRGLSGCRGHGGALSSCAPPVPTTVSQNKRLAESSARSANTALSCPPAALVNSVPAPAAVGTQISSSILAAPRCPPQLALATTAAGAVGFNLVGGGAASGDGRTHRHDLQSGRARGVGCRAWDLQAGLTPCAGKRLAREQPRCIRRQ